MSVETLFQGYTRFEGELTTVRLDRDGDSMTVWIDDTAYPLDSGARCYLTRTWQQGPPTLSVESPAIHVRAEGWEGLLRE